MAAIVAFQLQDWLRRYYFVEENSRAVFVNDVVSYGGQVVSLIVLFAAGLLDVATSLWVIAGSSALAFGLGWSRERITPAWRESGQTLLQGWRMGRNYLLAAQFQWVGSQGVLLVGASFLGVQTAGGIRAAQNIVGPINILFQVMENVVPVRAARRFTTEGRSGLVEYLKEITVIGSAALFPVFLVLGFCSTILMDIAYGQQYLAYASLVVWQVGYFAVTFYLRQIIYFHRSINQTRVIAVSSVVLALVAIGLSLMVVPEFAETGIMFSLVAGQLTGLVFLIAAARRRS